MAGRVLKERSNKIEVPLGPELRRGIFSVPSSINETSFLIYVLLYIGVLYSTSLQKVSAVGEGGLRWRS